MGCDYRFVNLGTHIVNIVGCQHTSCSHDKLTNIVNTFMACDYRVVNLETHNSCCQVISWQTL